MRGSKSYDVVIIGAGLTGLATALFLKEKGKSVYLLEKEDRCGGVIQTWEKDSFTFESGPNTGLANCEEVDLLFRLLEGLCEFESPKPEAKFRWIWKDNRWNPLPSGFLSAISTPLFSWKDKFKILGEPWRKKGTNPDESVADMVIRRLGKSFLDYAIDPFISGVYAGDPAYLINRWAMPKMYNLEQSYGSFVKGALRKKRENKLLSPRKYKGTFSVKGGLYRLIEALEKKIGSKSIGLLAKDIQILPEGNSYKITATLPNEVWEIYSKNVVVTVGSAAYSEIAQFIAPEEYSYIKALRYAPIAQVAVGFRQWRGPKLNAFGGLIPAIEKRNSLGILFPSSIFEGKSPVGGALLSVFCGGFRHPEIVNLSDTELEELVLSEIAETLQISEPKPHLISIHRYLSAIPQYGIDTGERLVQINALQKKYPGLFLAGNIRDGIGMADRIKQGAALTQEICSM